MRRHRFQRITLGAVAGLALFGAALATAGEPPETLPEAEGYRLVFDLDLNKAKGEELAYDVDRSRETAPYERVAYWLTLKDAGGQSRWIWVALDTFSDDARQLGVPTTKARVRFHQAVKNVQVRSNVDGVKQGDGLEGWMEFWPNNYGPTNPMQVPNASETTFDWGDQVGETPGPGYGSMQIHLPGEKQVLFAYNNWRAQGPEKADLGIGNNPKGNPDHTFANNAGQYPEKRLRVLVK